MTRDPWAGYDAWLERPYQEAAERGEQYERTAELHDLDPDTDGDEIERRMAEDREAELEAKAERIAEYRDGY
jgi:hypothetical protein